MCQDSISRESLRLSPLFQRLPTQEWAGAAPPSGHQRFWGPPGPAPGGPRQASVPSRPQAPPAPDSGRSPASPSLRAPRLAHVGAGWGGRQGTWPMLGGCPSPENPKRASEGGAPGPRAPLGAARRGLHSVPPGVTGCSPRARVHVFRDTEGGESLVSAGQPPCTPPGPYAHPRDLAATRRDGRSQRGPHATREREPHGFRG